MGGVPSLTIITTVLNGEPHIAEMLSSIPTDLPIEHLVIDGGSTDGTFDRLGQTPGITLLSRPGMSLYAAWNYALDQAAGQAVWFVNADDVVAPTATEAAVAALEKHPEADIIQGRAEAFECVDTVEVRETSFRYPAPGEHLNVTDLVFGAPVINSRIYRRRLIDRSRPFDTSYRFAADRDWLLQMAVSDRLPVCVEIDSVLYRYRVHAGSMTLSQDAGRRLAIAEEHTRIADGLLSGTPIPSETRELLQAWRARELLVAAVSSLRTRRWKQGLHHGRALLSGARQSARFLSRARRGRLDYVGRLDYRWKSN